MRQSGSFVFVINKIIEITKLKEKVTTHEKKQAGSTLTDVDGDESQNETRYICLVGFHI